MSLLTKWTWVGLSGPNIKRFENLGYYIPRHWDSNNKKWSVKIGTKIFVKTEDLLQKILVKEEDKK